MKNKKNQITCMLLTATLLIFQGCKKEKDKHVPPDVTFITTTGYIYSDTTLPTDTTVQVGIVATRTEDELRTLNVSHSFDNSTATVSDTTIAVSGNEVGGFTRTINISTRPNAGTEKYIFTVTDKDGNITTKSLILTVQ